MAGIEVSELGNSYPGAVHAVSVAARWSLSGMAGSGADGGERPAEAAGMTLLVLERDTGGRWRIVHDASF